MGTLALVISKKRQNLQFYKYHSVNDSSCLIINNSQENKSLTRLGTEPKIKQKRDDCNKERAREKGKINALNCEGPETT